MLWDQRAQNWSLSQGGMRKACGDVRDELRGLGKAPRIQTKLPCCFFNCLESQSMFYNIILFYNIIKYYLKRYIMLWSQWVLLEGFVPGGRAGKQKVQDVWNNQNWILDGILCAEEFPGKGSAAPTPSQSLWPPSIPPRSKGISSPPQPVPLCVLIDENNFPLIPRLSRPLPDSVLLFKVPAFCRDVHFHLSFSGSGSYFEFFFFCFLYFWHQREFHGRVQITGTNNLFCF